MSIPKNVHTSSTIYSLDDGGGTGTITVHARRVRSITESGEGAYRPVVQTPGKHEVVVQLPLDDMITVVLEALRDRAISHLNSLEDTADIAAALGINLPVVYR